MRRSIFIVVLLLSLLIACKEDAPYDLATEIIDGTQESATDIVLTFSDSGRVSFRIYSPWLKKIEQDNRLIEEFPNGLLIEFYDENLEVNSSVYANYAKHIGADGIMHLRDSVVFVNTAQDRIESNSIIWDQSNNQISTTKFFKLIRSATKDTIFGIGMHSRLDFSRMEVTQFEGKSQYNRLNE